MKKLINIVILITLIFPSYLAYAQDRGIVVVPIKNKYGSILIPTSPSSRTAAQVAAFKTKTFFNVDTIVHELDDLEPRLGPSFNHKLTENFRPLLSNIRSCTTTFPSPC